MIFDLASARFAHRPDRYEHLPTVSGGIGLSGAVVAAGRDPARRS
ncbi:MAG: hypothetical protein ABIR94_11405 [Rubrivivax sp.]